MGPPLALSSKKIVTTKNVIDGHLIIKDGIISEISSGPIPSSFPGEVLKFEDYLVFPGFIDLHIHGAGGYPLTEKPSDINNLARFLAGKGTAAFMPTTTSLGLDALKEQVNAVSLARKEQEDGAPGAKILGIHLEGPFLNIERKGAMVEKYLIDPSLEFFSELEEAAQGMPIRLTLAPEKEGAIDLIKYARKKGYIIAGGHTNATFEEMKEGINAGITVANHLFNAMNPLHHRKPGVVGAYLTDDRVFAEVIADGIHLHPAVLDLAFRCKGREKLVLISDAILAAGLPPGSYNFGGKKINIDEAGRSFLDDGTLAGSTALMPRGAEVLFNQVGLSLPDISAVASRNPALAVGEETLGDIVPGKEATFTILDKSFNPVKTIIRGQIQKEAQ